MCRLNNICGSYFWVLTDVAWLSRLLRRAQVAYIQSSTWEFWEFENMWSCLLFQSEWMVLALRRLRLYYSTTVCGWAKCRLATPRKPSTVQSSALKAATSNAVAQSHPLVLCTLTLLPTKNSRPTKAVVEAAISKTEIGKTQNHLISRYSILFYSILFYSMPFHIFFLLLLNGSNRRGVKTQDFAVMSIVNRHFLWCSSASAPNEREHVTIKGRRKMFETCEIQLQLIAFSSKD